jgi:hypothetical protein
MESLLNQFLRVLTMVYCTGNNHVFEVYPSSNVSNKAQRFGNWIFFRPQVK